MTQGDLLLNRFMGGYSVILANIGSSPGKHEQGATVGALFVGKPNITSGNCSKDAQPFLPPARNSFHNLNPGSGGDPASFHHCMKSL